jgi:hypothetical protein
VVQEFVGERQGTQGLASIGTSVDLFRDILSIGAEARVLVGVDARSDVTQTAAGLTSDGSRTIVGGEWLGSLRTSLFSGALTVLGGGGGLLPLDGLLGVGRVRFVLAITYAPTVRVEDTKPRPFEPPPAPELEPEPEAEPPPAASTVTPTPAPPPRPPPPHTPKPPPGRCAVRCTAEAPLPPKDEAALVSRTEPLLKDLRACLTRVGGERIDPAVLLRFSPSGQLVNVRIDVGGHEHLDCVKEAGASALALPPSRVTTARCQLHCE